MVKHQYTKPQYLLLYVWIVICGVWLIANTPYGYQNTSDIGLHLYNLKHISHTGFSWYNSQWYWGQEYLVVYAPGAYLIGALFSWMAPGVAGAIIALKVLVMLFTLVALYTTYWLVREYSTDDRVAFAAALLYSCSPFVWSSLQHSILDFTAYALIPAVILLVIRSVTHRSVKLIIAAGAVYALQVLISPIVAYHTLVAFLICALFFKRNWITARKLVAIGVCAALLAAFWILPFVSYVFSPTYGESGKLSFNQGSFASRYIGSMSGALNVQEIVTDVIYPLTPVARHALPLILLILSLGLFFFTRKEQKKLIHPFAAIAALSLILAVFSFAGNAAAFGLGILQEHSRWFDIANFSLAVLGAATLILLWDRVRKHSVKRFAYYALILLLGVVFVWHIAFQHKTIVVRDVLEHEKDVYTWLEQDTSTHRIVEFPYLYFAASGLEHHKDELLGSCQSCNRYQKVRTGLFFEPLTTKQWKESDMNTGSEYYATYFAALNTKYVVVYDSQTFPELNLPVVYRAQPAFTFAPQFREAFVKSDEYEGAYWSLQPKAGVAIANNTLSGTFHGLMTLGKPVLCSAIVQQTKQAAVHCSADQYAITILGIPAVTQHEQLRIPYGASPVADRIFGTVRVVNLLNPMFSVHKEPTTRVQTTTVYENMLVRPRIESVEKVHALGSPAFETYFNRTLSGETDSAAAYTEHIEATFAPATLGNITHANTQYSFSVQSTAESFIVVREGFAPGWHAYVDNSEVAVTPVEPAIMGVQVPAGSHQVVLRYEQSSLVIIGAIITVLALIGCIVFAVKK
jgi:hypothetical protein